MTNSISATLETSVPWRIAENGDHQSYLCFTPQNTVWKESPNGRQNHYCFAPTCNVGVKLICLYFYQVEVSV